VPFLLLYAADEVTISTRVEDDATGVRSVRVVAQPQAKAALDEGKITALLPHSPMRRVRIREATDSYRVTGDLRFTDADAIGDLRVERHVRLRPWPLFETVYTYTDKLTRTEFAERERDVAAAPKTEFTYSVTMPGEIDPNSLLPPDGIPQGSTVTWKLKADKATQDIAVTATRPDWPPMAFVALLIVLGILSLVRFLRRREQTTPRRI
jgi:hypothetical protein